MGDSPDNRKLDNWYTSQPDSESGPADEERLDGGDSGYLGEFEQVEGHQVGDQDLGQTRLDGQPVDDAGMPRPQSGPLRPDDLDDEATRTVMAPIVMPGGPNSGPGNRGFTPRPPRSQGPQGPRGPRQPGPGGPGPGRRGPGQPGEPPTAPLRRQGGSGNGRDKQRKRLRLAALAVLAIFLIALVAIGILPNPLKLLGFGGGSGKPQASNSASAPIHPASTAPANHGSAPGGGIATPTGSASASATSPSANATPSATGSAGTNQSPGAAVTPSVSASAGTVCVTTNGWNTAPQVSAQQVHRQAPIVSATPGVHGNCDRLVFVIKGDHPFRHGSHVGINVSYATRVLMDPKGTLMPLENQPALRLVILAPSGLHVDNNGYVISPDQLKSIATGVNGSFSELRWVKFGGSFEGQTQLVISVKDKHPFAAFSTVDAQGNLVVVVDVAALAHGDAVSASPVANSEPESNLYLSTKPPFSPRPLRGEEGHLSNILFITATI